MSTYLCYAEHHNSPDTPRVLHAASPSDAAECYAEYLDWTFCEFPDERTVFIADRTFTEEPVYHKYIVRAEPIRVYKAKSIS